MFEKVQVLQGDDEQQFRTCFLCIAKQYLYFVARSLDRLLYPKLSYLDIERVQIDDDTRRIFKMQLSDSQSADTILVESHHRDLLLERIGLCWQATFMYKHYVVKKFPMSSAKISSLFKSPNKNNIDKWQVQPFEGYTDTFKHRGYSIFLRNGFKSMTGLKLGNWTHPEGWEVKYGEKTVTIPPVVEVTLHVNDLVPVMELEKMSDGSDDLRTVATAYKQAISQHLDRCYTLANSSYMKKMNRNFDLASWDGWQFLIRSEEVIFAVILFRREYIPPLCDMTQDITLILRCPTTHSINHEACEVLLDEAQFIADSIVSTSECREPYYEVVQARLDTLQCNEDTYRWMDGTLQLVPRHKKNAIRFVKSIISILKSEGQIWDDKLLEDEVFTGISELSNPLEVTEELLSDAEPLLGATQRDERRNSWRSRIARYLAYCVDDGIMGDRFNLGLLVSQVSKSADESTSKQLKGVVDFLLHVSPMNDWSRSFSGARLPLAQLLQDGDFHLYMFNERVMRLLLTEGYIAAEWKRKGSQEGATYEQLLASLLTSDNVGIGLRTLICRQILETVGQVASGAQEEENKKEQAARARVLVPSLLKVMQVGHLSLTTCATAALVNLSYQNDTTKTIIVSEGGIKLTCKHLKDKDEELTLYTLHLLVNLTKTPQHRSLVVKYGGIPIIVDILTSSYQSMRKQKVLTEVASVLGQLCNDPETRSLLSTDFPTVPCLLWVFEAAPPNSKPKKMLMFALRQLCGLKSNRIPIGAQIIPSLIEDLCSLNYNSQISMECGMHSILLLIELAKVSSNALKMQGNLEESLQACGIFNDRGEMVEAKKTKFSPTLLSRISELLDLIKRAQYQPGL